MEKRDEFEERSTAFHSTIPFNSIEEAEKNKRKKKKRVEEWEEIKRRRHIDGVTWAKIKGES